MTMTLNSLAAKVAQKAFPGYTLDPATLAAIIAALTNLIPLIQECRKKNETQEEAARRLARSRGPLRLIVRWQTRREVRKSFGVDASYTLVKTIADAMIETGRKKGNVIALFQAAA